MTKKDSKSGLSNRNFISDLDNSEIDIGKNINLLVRNKVLIGSIASTGLFIGLIIGNVKQTIWQGEFKILVSKNQSSMGFGAGSTASQFIQNNNQILGQLGIQTNAEQNIKTEVEVLKTPSVMKPVFDFIKNKKIETGEEGKNWRYRDWVKESFKINIPKGTSILEITYQDTSRDLIIPVLNKISSAYQGYSRKDRSRSITKGLKYLEKQIEVYREKSLSASSKVQEYALENDLSFSQTQSSLGGKSNFALGVDSNPDDLSNLEYLRISSRNRIRNIDEYIGMLDGLQPNSEQIVSIASGFYSTNKITSLILDELMANNSVIATKLAYFTEEDPMIKRLKKKKLYLIKSLNNELRSHLIANKEAAISLLNTSNRPKDVLIKFRELTKEAQRDEATLLQLEGSKRILALEEARIDDPWELITQPILLDQPVGPRKKRILALGLLFGGFAGYGLALVKEKKSQLIYETKEIESLLDYPLLLNLKTSLQSKWDESLGLLVDGVAKKDINGSLALLPIGDTSKIDIEIFKLKLKKALGGNSLITTTNLVEAKKASQQIIVTSPGICTADQIKDFKNNLALQGKPVLGYIVIEDI